MAGRKLILVLAAAAGAALLAGSAIVYAGDGARRRDRDLRIAITPHGISGSDSVYDRYDRGDRYGYYRSDRKIMREIRSNERRIRSLQRKIARLLRYDRYRGYSHRDRYDSRGRYYDRGGV